MFEIYCDESRQDLFYSKKTLTDNNKYIFIGGILINSNDREKIKNEINNLKKEYNLNKKLELKWNMVTEKYIELYKKLIDVYIDNDIDFRAICIDASKLNLKYHEDNPELGFYKFYFQLLNKWLKNNQKYIIYTDIKTNRNPNVLNDLKRCLNGREHSNVVERIYAIESHESVFLQLEDIIMGIASYKKNFGYNGCSKTKLELIRYLESKLNHKIESTPKSAKKFNLFEIRMRNE